MARRTCCGRRLNMLRALIALIVLGLSACASVNPKAVPGDNVAAALQLDQAEQLVADKNWPQAIAALQVVIEARPFHRYPSDIRYRALSTAGKVAANPAQFDIEAAADQEFRWFQSASEKTPQSLELQSDVIRVLAQQQHYAAMLASADSVLFAIQSTNFPRKLYQDYDEQLSWFLNLREVALERAGRWDEAVAQLTKASLLSEEYSGNVSQLINLGSLYCALGRPKEALTAIDSVLAATSAYGASAMEMVRLDAAVQMGDSKQVRHSLRFLRTHRADSSSDYEYALIVTNQLDRAAGQLKAQLLDQDERQHALLSVQTYAPATGTARELELDARQRIVIARRDVQAVIQRVGRVETYRLESDAYN